jgi:hypothetical protein
MKLNILNKFFAPLLAFVSICGSGSLRAQNSLSFDGTDDRVSCGNDTSVQITGKQLTLEAWIYPTSFKTNPWDCNVICKEDNSANYGYMLRIGGSGQLNFAPSKYLCRCPSRNSVVPNRPRATCSHSWPSCPLCRLRCNPKGWF